MAAVSRGERVSWLGSVGTSIGSGASALGGGAAQLGGAYAQAALKGELPRGNRSQPPPQSPLPPPPRSGNNLLALRQAEPRAAMPETPNPFYVNATGRLAYRQPVPMLPV
jgi:hypothetical protein